MAEETARRSKPHQRLLTAVCLLAIASMGTGAAEQPATGRTVLIRAAQIIDGRGGPPIVNGAVLIRGERIERVAPADGMKADQVIDLGSATLLPGLIDLHTHLTDEVGTNWESALLTTTPGRAAHLRRGQRTDDVDGGLHDVPRYGPDLAVRRTSICGMPSTRARYRVRGSWWPATTCRRPAAPATRGSSPST